MLRDPKTNETLQEILTDFRKRSGMLFNFTCVCALAFGIYTWFTVDIFWWLNIIIAFVAMIVCGGLLTWFAANPVVSGLHRALNRIHDEFGGDDSHLALAETLLTDLTHSFHGDEVALAEAWFNDPRSLRKRSESGPSDAPKP
jgi:hypothetical protein